jgi:hypothetical protein
MHRTLREWILQKMLVAVNVIALIKVYRVALWILGRVLVAVGQHGV